MKTQTLTYRAIRPSGRIGFTLVELLVVMGIIAILAGVSLGPILKALGKGKQSAGLQTAHQIGIAMFAFANDNNQLYPDIKNPSNNTATGAAAVVQPLLAGGYISDPSIFYLSGGTATKYAGSAAAAAATFASNNSSWDFVGVGSGVGISTSNYQYLPILWSSITTPPTISGASSSGAQVTATPTASNPFGTDGMAVFYINNASKFVVSTLQGGTPTVVLVKALDNSGGAPADATVLSGGG